MTSPFDSVAGDPLAFFDRWLDEARACEGIRYAGAACLSTVDGHGAPDARWVIVHDRLPAGFLIGTDERSPKVRQIDREPRAALTFYWEPLDRQVRIRGTMTPGGPDESDRTFRDRPRESRVTAWASRQSRPLSDRTELEDRWREAGGRLAGEDPIARPPWWRAWLLAPAEVELWQAASGRLHHRLRSTREPDGSWTATLLEP